MQMSGRFWLEEVSGGLQFHYLLKADQVALQAFNVSIDRDSNVSERSVPVFHSISWWRISFLLSELTLLHFVTSCTFAEQLWEEPAPVSSVNPFRRLRIALRSPLSLFFSGPNTQVPSAHPAMLQAPAPSTGAFYSKLMTLFHSCRDQNQWPQDVTVCILMIKCWHFRIIWGFFFLVL